ncbi:MAG: hypothetical protein PHN89_02975 [Candidatus Pacebacteria bacterium]|nr:hypothetical protein [Candidatus Paceibacterota bacterium]
MGVGQKDKERTSVIRDKDMYAKYPHLDPSYHRREAKEKRANQAANSRPTDDGRTVHSGIPTEVMADVNPPRGSVTTTATTLPQAVSKDAVQSV